jgi:hypothetical protein
VWVALLLVLAAPAGTPAQGASGSVAAVPAVGAMGYDVSFPQCQVALPTTPTFALVGVNGGLANDANPCLAQQLAWAQAAPGLRHPAVAGLSLYLDAADPGNGVPDWPSPAAGTAAVPTPYGSCDGSFSRACAYGYGVQRAGYSYGLVAAATPPLATGEASPATGEPPLTAGTSALAATAPWWIDVEIEASWARRSSSSEWSALNVAALRGFVAGLRAAGARGAIGLYSNGFQWHAITGLSPRASRAAFPLQRDWVTGSSSAAQARHACAQPFSAKEATLAQFAEGGYDRDVVCPPARGVGRRGGQRHP